MTDTPVKTLINQLSRLTTSRLYDVSLMRHYKNIFIALINQITESEAIQFTSLFAQLDFLTTKYHLSSKTSYLLHKFRRHCKNIEEEYPIDLAQYAIDTLLTQFLNEDPVWNHDAEKIYTTFKSAKQTDVERFIKSQKIYLLKINISQGNFLARTLAEPFEEITVSFSRTDRNEDFEDLFKELDKLQIGPITVNTIDIEVGKDQVWYPSIFVFEPDYLYDVTSISECFGPFVNEHLGYLVKKFKPMASSDPILIGNAANYFLDQLIYQEDLRFTEIKKSIFRLDPLGYALKSDEELVHIINKLEKHFENIKTIIKEKFKSIPITKETSFIEPSFYSAKYGIQGRLDLLSINNDSANIIELKSGKPYKTNTYGLNNSHYHQTLLYDLLIESALGYNVKRNNFILYSQIENNGLKYAPGIKSEQREAIKVRNKLFLIDKRLCSKEPFINQLKEIKEYFGDTIKGFLAQDTAQLINTFERLDELSLSYCDHLIRFVFTELFMSKLGDESSEHNGLAGLWTTNMDHKISNFNILNHLVISANYSYEEEPLLYLSRSEKTSVLSNFREGDIAVLYPDQNSIESALRHQVFKCSVISIQQDHIVIRLRSRQENEQLFSNFIYWHLEHDVLESGFNRMTASIMEFAQSSKRFQRLILGIERPSTFRTLLHKCGDHLTFEQRAIFNEALSAKDYYLLWGPPGTGKTSVLLKELSDHFYNHTEERILLLAYTNKAVDEICEALLKIEDQPHFTRIGSKYGTAHHLQEHLLDEQIKSLNSRKELNYYLSNERIYVGTVASVLGKDSLFKLLKFDICIIDEASQILEASLIGLLSRVSKFILIGDHRQLPAVVQQKESISKVEDLRLNQIGIENFNNSLFERLYKNAQNNGWHHIIGQLSFQGRMHESLMKFSNEYYYEGRLKTLEELRRLTQHEIPHIPLKENSSFLNNRIVYCNTHTDYNSESIKINNYEAEATAKVIKLLVDFYKVKKIRFTDMSIGVITPYRAQIAAIRAALLGHEIEYQQLISIDTVERYQGSARDIIILSTALNYTYQLKSLCSLSDDGLDRKLNVAFTRAKEQFILIGNKEILSLNKLYKSLISRSTEIKSTDL